MEHSEPSPKGGSSNPPSEMGLRLELFVADLNAFKYFYTRVLRFTVTLDKRQQNPPDPYIAVQRDGVRIAGAAGSDTSTVDKKCREVPHGVEIVLMVDDLKAEHQHVIEAGWSLDEDLQRRPWGLTDFRVKDPDGYYLRITNRR
jgi:lactoylglutathione lyase